MTVARIPPRPSAAGWIVDREALEAALLELHIRYPLRVLLTTGWRKAGNAGVDRYGHRVRISGRHPLERANRFLWHELAHSAQRERDLHSLCLEGLDEGARIFLMQVSGRRLVLGDAAFTPAEVELERDYHAGGPTHQNHPLEVEARAVADAHAGELLLRPARQRCRRCRRYAGFEGFNAAGLCGRCRTRT